MVEYRRMQSNPVRERRYSRKIDTRISVATERMAVWLNDDSKSIQPDFWGEDVCVACVHVYTSLVCGTDPMAVDIQTSKSSGGIESNFTA